MLFSANQSFPRPQEDEPLNDQETLDLQALFQFVKRRWSLVAAWIAIGLCCGIVFFIFSPSYYAAYTTVLISDAALRPAGAAAIQADAANPATYIYSQIQVLQSNEVLVPVIRSQHLVDDPEFGGVEDGITGHIVQLARSLLAYVRVMEGNKAPPAPTQDHLTMIRLKRALSIQQLSMSNAIQIGITSRSPIKAAAIANAIAESYINSQLERKRQNAEMETKRLRVRLDELRKKAFSAQEVEAQAAGEATDMAAAAHFKELQDDAEIYRALYNAAKRQYMNAGQQVVSADARIISAAEPPLRKHWPRAFLVLIAAAGAGGLIGSGHALIRQATDRTLYSVDDVRRLTQLGFVYDAPNISRWVTETGGSSPLQRSYRVRSPHLEDWLAKIVVRLTDNGAEEGARIVGVAATTPGAGASLIAAHLARILTTNGFKTLLIDANWKKKRGQSKTQGQGSVHGLTNESTKVQLSSHVLDVSVLRELTELRATNATFSILEALRSRRAEGLYDYIFVDFSSIAETADLAGSIGILDDIVLVTEPHPAIDALRESMRVVPRTAVTALIVNKASRATARTARVG